MFKFYIWRIFVFVKIILLSKTKCVQFKKNYIYLAKYLVLHYC